MCLVNIIKEGDYFMQLSKNIATKGLKKYLISIDFNESCNLHCLNCPRQFRFSTEYNEYWIEDEAKRLLDWLFKNTEARELHVGILAEFCLYKYNSQILEYINEKYSNIKTIITTNLTNMSDKLFDTISKCGNNITINVSLWASSSKEYEKLQGGNLKLYNNVINNIEKLMSIYKKSNFKLMISTVNYSTQQLNGVKTLVKSLCDKYDLEYVDKVGNRSATPNKVTLYTNVFTGNKNIGENPHDIDTSEICNTSKGYICNLVSNGIYMTYNKLFPCINVPYRCKFNIGNMNDLKYKIMKLLDNENTMEECKNCTVAYSCMGM